MTPRCYICLVRVAEPWSLKTTKLKMPLKLMSRSRNLQKHRDKTSPPIGSIVAPFWDYLPYRIQIFSGFYYGAYG